MKRKINVIFFLLAIFLLSGCAVFKPGCGCPKVSMLPMNGCKTTKTILNS